MKNNMLLNAAAAAGLDTGGTVANLTAGSTLGIDGIRTVSLDAATPLVFPPAVIVVTQMPTMYNSNPEFAQMLKTIIETHPTGVSNIDVEYTLNTEETKVGHDGQTIKVPTQTERSAINPEFTFQEVTGNLIWESFYKWITDTQDADTEASMTHIDGSASALPWVSSTYSMSIAVIQFDPTFQPDNIIGGAFISNMFPTTPGGGMGLERQIGQSAVKERSVSFTGYLRHNRNTRGLLVDIAKKLSLGAWGIRSAVTRPHASTADEIAALWKDSDIGKAIGEIPNPA